MTDVKKFSKVKILLLFFAINCIFLSCTKNCVPHIPGCIQQRINQVMKEPKRNPPAEIYEYRYNGQTVYLVNANCCDQFDELLNRLGVSPE